MKFWFFISTPNGEHLIKCRPTEAWDRLLSLCVTGDDFINSTLKEVR